MIRGQQFDPNEGLEIPKGRATLNNDVPWKGDNPQVKRLYRSQGELWNSDDPTIRGTFSRPLSIPEAQQIHKNINPNGRMFDIVEPFHKHWGQEESSLGGPLGMVGSGGAETRGLHGVEVGKEHLGRVPIPDEDGHLVFSSQEMKEPGQELSLGGVLHEASHTTPGHGPEFATKYLQAVHKHAGPHAAAALEQRFIRHGVDYNPNWNE
jgi:hypothetical protein